MSGWCCVETFGRKERMSEGCFSCIIIYCWSHSEEYVNSGLALEISTCIRVSCEKDSLEFEILSAA